MDEPNQLAELRAERDLFSGFLKELEDRQARLSAAGVNEGLGGAVVQYMADLRQIIAELERKIADLQRGG